LKFKIDENLPVEVVSEYGHGTNPSQAPQTKLVLARAGVESRVLLTLDLDFANIRTYPPAEHSGIIVLRLRAQDKMAVVGYVRRLAAAIQRQSSRGELWILERDRIRIRQS
jgi:predicted nuclease of predicted toxin-antitoxin system